MIRWLRRLAKALYLRFLFSTGLLRWARSRVARRGVVVITLHRVLPDEQCDSARLQPGMVVRASSFQGLLQYIRDNCKPVLPGEVIAGAGHEPPHRPRVALTFDDGWKDNFEIAFPLSRGYQAPFTVFLCPQMIDGQDGFWTSKVNTLWWTAHEAGKLDLVHTLCGGGENGSAAALIESLKHTHPKERKAFIARLQAALAPYTRETAPNQDRLMTWADVKEMANAGIAFGSHTNTHPILTDISDRDAAQEMTESKSAIEAQLNTCPWFAYPNGDWSQSVRDLAARAGYQVAFANSPGIWETGTDRFSVPRINLWEGSLAGWGGRFSRIALEYAIFWTAYRNRRQPI
jgi:peptidoglycan/xylan/chitin deacetylase (PgdA/CDA1 family)